MPFYKCIQGDSLFLLPTLPDSSIDSIVTDPPYELGFMGKSWDKSGIANNVQLWKECLRVLRPGGHLLAFSGSRTYHRMTCAIEDAGFVRPPSPRGNYHPTVKPTSLMRYLVRLVTPPGGTILDPFLGSGSTGKAAALEGFSFIGIDLDADYVKIAKARIDFAKKHLDA